VTLEEGRVVARVQGAQREPYESSIQFPRLSEESRARILLALRRKPIWVARLLTGDLPCEIEALFQAEGYPLIPHRTKELISRCSCPDWANPCKHLTAVYYLLGETIARNPLFLLGLYGITEADLVAQRDEKSPGGKTETYRQEVQEPIVEETLFYGTPQPEFSDFGEAAKSALPAPLIHRLGALPFWRGQERFIDTLEHLYVRAAARGWTVWTGETLDLRREDEKVVIKGANLHLRQNRMRVDASFL
jgi:uncharacterized Zn finger protein